MHTHALLPVAFWLGHCFCAILYSHLHPLFYVGVSNLMNKCSGILLPVITLTPFGHARVHLFVLPVPNYLPRVGLLVFCRNSWYFRAHLFGLSHESKIRCPICIIAGAKFSSKKACGRVLRHLQEISHWHLSAGLMLIVKLGFSFLLGDLLSGTVPWIGKTCVCLPSLLFCCLS